MVGRTWDGKCESGKLSGVSSRGDMQRKPRAAVVRCLDEGQRRARADISCDKSKFVAVILLQK